VGEFGAEHRGSVIPRDGREIKLSPDANPRIVHSSLGRCAPVISHSSSATGRDDIERCFINNAPQKGSVFEAGTILLRDCGFAGRVLRMPAGFMTTGDQQTYAGTQFILAAVLQETCPQQVPVEWTPMPRESRSPIVTIHKCGFADAPQIVDEVRQLNGAVRAASRDPAVWHPRPRRD
jgi:hypothetical protein